MTKSRGIMGSRHHWTDEDVALLTCLYPNTPTSKIAKQFGVSIERVYQKAKSIGLKKSAEYMVSPAACRLRRGDNIGTAYRFQRGGVAWNAGMKGLHTGGVATQFKPGRPPSEARNYKPLGSTRLSTVRYLERKVSDDKNLVPARRWVGVHRLVWESENGAIPPGHVVIFRKGMHTTNEQEITIDRLELISRQDLMRRNSYHQYGKEIAQLVQMRGAITRQINKGEKE